MSNFYPKPTLVEASLVLQNCRLVAQKVEDISTPALNTDELRLLAAYQDLTAWVYTMGEWRTMCQTARVNVKDLLKLEAMLAVVDLAQTAEA